MIGVILDGERAVRTAYLLLECAPGEGNEEVDGILALGICGELAQDRRQSRSRQGGYVR